MAKTHLVTWAQNATPVHKPFWRALLRYADDHNAELHVIAGRYKNPTAHWSQRAETDDWWAPEAAPFIADAPVRLCANLVVYGGVSITPTAERPLTGFEAHAGDHSAIFGHPRVQLTAVPRPCAAPRIFTSTGACTVPNYIPSKAGKKAERYHSMGACVVEVEAGGVYHIRQLVATKAGAIYDVDGRDAPARRYTPGGAYRAAGPHLVLGDLHAELHTDASRSSMMAAVRALAPRTLTVHDVLDFTTGGHHNRHRWWDGPARTREIRADLNAACSMLEQLAEVAPVTVVPSNHHDHLDRWLQETHPRESPHNAALWVRLWDLYYAGHAESGFERFLRHEYRGLRGARGVKFLRTDEPLWRAGVFCGYHGHRGMSGSRGSLRGFARLGARVVIGHSHSPGWLDGARQVGVMAPPDAFDYRKGQPDASLRTMCAIWPNGKTQLVNLIDGRFRPKGV